MVLLRGVNVGGHRTFRPAQLARGLAHLDVVNIGAAGTFVVRQRVSQAQLRAEFARRLPFETEIVICRGRDIAALAAGDWFRAVPGRADITRFVSVLARAPRTPPSLPLQLPPTGNWQVRLLAREHRFVIGAYRRQMQAAGLLGKIDEIFGVPATTRNWNTIRAITEVLEARGH